MARIRGERHTRTVAVPSTRRVSLEWLPLALALLGVGLIGGFGLELPAWAPLAGALLLGVGAYVLGRVHGQAAPDPSARGRVTQLERALLQFAVLLGNDGLTRAPVGRASGAPGAQPGFDAVVAGPTGRTDLDGPTIEDRLDDPLPGEAR